MGEQFVVGLQGAEPFGAGNGVDERAQQGRLPGSLVTGDDDPASSASHRNTLQSASGSPPDSNHLPKLTHRIRTVDLVFSTEEATRCSANVVLCSSITGKSADGPRRR